MSRTTDAFRTNVSYIYFSQVKEEEEAEKERE